jgi:glc operon protein GlcG
MGPTMSLQLPSRKSLTLEAARLAMVACEAEAARGGWKVVIAIVDDGGHPIMVHRLDGAQWSSCDTAVGKARAAVAWKRPTRLLEEVVNNGRFAFLSISQGMAILQGGVPLEIDGQVIGAIGVSGVKASDDELVALAGIHALQGALS